MFLQSRGFLIYSEFMPKLLWPVFFGFPCCSSQRGCGPWRDPTSLIKWRSQMERLWLWVVFYLFFGVVCAFAHERDQRVKGTFWGTAQLQSTGRMVVCSVGDFFPSTSCRDCPVTLMLTVNFSSEAKIVLPIETWLIFIVYVKLLINSLNCSYLRSLLIWHWKSHILRHHLSMLG